MGISLQDVSYSYNKKRKIEKCKLALDHINLTINKDDEFIAIVGKTGSGKSTLASIFNALKIPSFGDASICGIKIKEKRKRSENYNNIRKQVGLVFQFPEYQLFEETVLKDVMFGPKNFGLKNTEAEVIAKSALNKVNFKEELFDKSPFELSGGEKKMVSIVGILALDSDIYIFDEPTAGLDPISKDNVLKLFNELNKIDHKTIIMISHDMNSVYEYAKRVIVMDEHKLVFDGTPNDLFINHIDIVDKCSLDYPDTYKISKYLNDNLNMNLSLDNNNIVKLYEEIIRE